MSAVELVSAVLSPFGLVALADVLSEVARLRRLAQSERAHWLVRRGAPPRPQSEREVSR